MSTRKVLSRRGLVLATVITALLTLLPFMGFAQQPSSYKWPATFTISTLGSGTSDYGLTAAFAAKLQEGTGMLVRVVPQDISPLRIKHLLAGMCDLGTLSTGTTPDALEGLVNFATRDLGPSQLRTQWVTTTTGNGFMVRGDSKIKTIYDIKPGTKIAFFSGVPIFQERTDGLLAWVKLDKKDVNFIPVSNWRANTWSVVDGTADLCVTSTISPATYEAESSPHGIRWLSLPVDKDPEGLKRLLNVVPSSDFYANKYGPKSSIGITLWRDENLLLSSDKADEELIYQLTKWRAENFDSYKNVHPLLPQTSVENMRRWMNITYTPVHKGVIRYFKEIGKWTPVDDAWQNELTDLLTRYVKAYKVAIEKADSTGIKVDNKNSGWLDLWQNYKKETGLPRFKIRK